MTPTTPKPSSSAPSGEFRTAKPKTFDVLRRRFVAGLITVIPALITVWAVLLIVRIVNDIFGPIVRPPIMGVMFWLFEDADRAARYVGPLTVFFSLIVAVATITAVGWLSRFLVVRRLIQIGEDIVTRVPMIKFFYLTPKEVINTLTSTRSSFKRVVLVEFPRKGSWCLAFATGEIINKGDDDRVYATIFMPSTPNPTTGFMMIIPIEEVLDVNLTVEDGVRMMISGGILSPDTITTVPFVGLHRTPDLPPAGPLTAEIPQEVLKKASESQAPIPPPTPMP